VCPGSPVLSTSPTGNTHDWTRGSRSATERRGRGTEAVNGVIEKTRRLAHGFRNFTSYRIRILLAAETAPAPTGVRRPRLDQPNEPTPS
jgi:hypothetical protein